MQDFIDTVRITARSGHGGAGSVSFRREKFIPKGGPDGGDGGDGGHVLVRVSEHERTLRALRRNSLYSAQNGHPGAGKNRHGKNGEHVILQVPLGTIIKNASDGAVVARLFQPADEVELLRGGIGGRGNTWFKSATRQAPEYAQKGLPGAEQDFVFELELYADASFIGFPNVGKSTLLKTLTNANPKIGNYPFTTLIPNMGTLHLHHTDIILSDIPGIIEGASRGQGLGLHFLRHVKRSASLVFMLDGALPAPSMAEQLATLWKEAGEYGRRYAGAGETVDLTSKPFCILISRADLSMGLDGDNENFSRSLGDERLGPAARAEYAAECAEYLRESKAVPKTMRENIADMAVLCVSSHAMFGIEELKEQLFAMVSSAKKAEKAGSKIAAGMVLNTAAISANHAEKNS